MNPRHSGVFLSVCAMVAMAVLSSCGGSESVSAGANTTTSETSFVIVAPDQAESLAVFSEVTKKDKPIGVVKGERVTKGESEQITTTTTVVENTKPKRVGEELVGTKKPGKIEVVSSEVRRSGERTIVVFGIDCKGNSGQAQVYMTIDESRRRTGQKPCGAKLSGSRVVEPGQNVLVEVAYEGSLVFTANTSGG